MPITGDYRTVMSSASTQASLPKNIPLPRTPHEEALLLLLVQQAQSDKTGTGQARGMSARDGMGVLVHAYVLVLVRCVCMYAAPLCISWAACMDVY